MVGITPQNREECFSDKGRGSLFWSRFTPKKRSPQSCALATTDNAPGRQTTDHNWQIATNFITSLVDRAMIPADYDDASYLRKYRNELVKILWLWYKLDYLLCISHLVTQNDLDIIEKLILIRGYPECCKEHRYTFESVEEAALFPHYTPVGKAAHAYILLKAIVKERDRQQKIKQAEKEMKEAQENYKKAKTNK